MMNKGADMGNKIRQNSGKSECGSFIIRSSLHVWGHEIKNVGKNYELNVLIVFVFTLEV
jgi:hypothetical protein